MSKGGGRIKQFAVNVALLTVTSLIMRTVGVSFNVYVTNRLGASGVGLLTLITSTYGFFTTFALSGVNLAASRLAAEGLGHDNPAEIRAAMNRCIMYAAFFGSVAVAAMYLSAGIIGEKVISDSRSIRSLRILAPSLLPLAMSSAIYGYLHAVRRVIKSATAQITEQIVRIAVTVYALSIFLPRGLEYACFAVTLGITISEMAAFIYNFVLFRMDLRVHNDGSGRVPGNLTKKMLGISLPMALSAYARSGLLTLEHMLIPYGLRRSGASGDKAIAEYGILHGMAFPVVLYPQVLLQSVSGLLVPEFAEESARGNEKNINNIAKRVIKMTLLFSIGTSAVMCCFSKELGMLIYGSEEASRYIKIMAPLIPAMYLDSAVDGMLKGLGEQLYSMRVNILDSSLSVVMVWLLLPVMGVKGYIVTVYVCEILNGALSLYKLLAVTKLKIPVMSAVVKPLCGALISCTSVKMFYESFGNVVQNGIFNLIIHFLSAFFVYFVMLILLRCIRLPKYDENGLPLLSTLRKKTPYSRNKLTELH